ncbi:MAG: hypothetical protein HYX59_09460 [Elusimicrobia bacterium]|nr:hypothetical protein [Elusimicrobiota bacterium]
MKTILSLGRRGQILPGAVAMLVILAIMVPSIVLWIQRETVFASKQSHNTVAFHLAEAGVEKAYLFVSLSTITWNNIQAGQAQTDYSFDKTYSDITGGTYTISITSGPGTQQVTIVTVGRDRFRRETRALRVVYSNTILGDTAIFAGQGVKIAGGTNVHWGAVMSPSNIDATSRSYPQYWSASQIIGKDTSANPPNCDSPGCCQWHAFQTSLPTPPSLDFDFYRTSAAATAGCPAGGTPAGSCYYAGNVVNWDNTTAGKTIFIEGDLSVKSPGMFHTGTLIVMGNINLPNGVWGKGTVSMTMPTKAWKQYCNAWPTYIAYGNDSTEPPDFPGLNSTYQATVTPVVSSKVSVNGFLYVGGNFNNGGGGGGNSDVYGVLYAIGTSTLSAASPIDFYYNGNATSNIVTTNVSLTRSSWQDEVRGWPSGL